MLSHFSHCLTFTEHQGRNHGIDIGGGSKCEPFPRYIFFKCISHNSQFSYIDKDLLI